MESDQLSSCPCAFSPSGAQHQEREKEEKTPTGGGKETLTHLKEGEKITYHPLPKTRVI